MLLIERVTGRIVADAKANHGNNKPVVNFSLAINDRYKTKEGEVKESTTFIDCAIWNRPSVAQYLTKGALIEVSGRLSTKAYLNTSSEPKSALRISVREFKFHSSGKSTAAPAPADQQIGKNKTGAKGRRTKPLPAAADITEPIDDLPF